MLTEDTLTCHCTPDLGLNSSVCCPVCTVHRSNAGRLWLLWDLRQIWCLLQGEEGRWSTPHSSCSHVPGNSPQCKSRNLQNDTKMDIYLEQENNVRSMVNRWACKKNVRGKNATFHFKWSSSQSAENSLFLHQCIFGFSILWEKVLSHWPTCCTQMALRALSPQSRLNRLKRALRGTPAAENCRRATHSPTLAGNVFV